MNVQCNESHRRAFLTTTVCPVWNTVISSFFIVSQCGKSKCIVQSMLGKEPESTNQVWPMQLCWIQIQLFRLRLWAGCEKDHWSRFSCALHQRHNRCIIYCTLFVFVYSVAWSMPQIQFVWLKESKRSLVSTTAATSVSNTTRTALLSSSALNHIPTEPRSSRRALAGSERLLPSSSHVCTVPA